jgi:peptidoglycan/LPS O-acetylase OafA/YrhL
MSEPLLNRTVLRTGDSVFGAWLVVAMSAVAGSSRFEAKDFVSKGIRHIGKVSYGLYLFHKAVPTLLVWMGVATTDWFWWFAEYSPLPIFRTDSLWYAPVFRITEFTYELGVSVLLATVSWRFFERFFNRLKRFVGYEGMRPDGKRPGPSND